MNLDILPYDEQRLELGAFHIEEPTGNDTVDISHIELIVVPAVHSTARETASAEAKDTTIVCLPDQRRQKSVWVTNSSS